MTNEFNEEQLEQNAKNPHYSMGSQELKALEQFRNKNYDKKKASTKFEKANSSFQRHETELESEDDE